MLGCCLHWVEVCGWVVLWFLFFGLEGSGWFACCGIAGAVRVLCRVVWGPGVILVWGWLGTAGDGLLNGIGFVRVGLVGACIGEVGSTACRCFWIRASRHASWARVMTFSCSYHARIRTSGTCVMTCALLLSQMRLVSNTSNVVHASFLSWLSSLSTWDCGSGQCYVQIGLQPLVSGLLPGLALH